MKITEFTKYRDSEEIISRIEIRDNKKNIIEEVDFDDNGQQLIKTTYEYNDKGQPVVVTQYDEDNLLIEKKKIEYDSEGREIFNLIEFPDGSITKETKKREGNFHVFTQISKSLLSIYTVY